MINPVTTEAQDHAIESAAKKMGIPGGPKASIEFRTTITILTDTYANGPMTAAQILTELGEK